METKPNYENQKIEVFDRNSMISENLGISGTKIILNRKASMIRRCLWLLLVLTMTGVMVWQIIKRVDTFFSFPLAVNVEISYEKHVRFPVIVICNENVATISGAYASKAQSKDKLRNHLTVNIDYWSVYEKIYQNQSMINETLKWFMGIYGQTQEHITSRAKSEAYSSRISHKLSSMLKRCLWQNMPCTENDFKPVVDGMISNQCYVFNANEKDPLYTNLAGKSGALHLRLDVQQYQYVGSKLLGAGITVGILDDTVNIYMGSEMSHHISAGKSVRDWSLLYGINNAKFTCDINLIFLGEGIYIVACQAHPALVFSLRM